MTGFAHADMFAGLGGFSEGAEQAGSHTVWAGNHWPVAVETHAANHPLAVHVCADMHATDFTAVPRVDMLLAGPACQGHSAAGNARAGERAKVKHDADRATALAVINALEVIRPAWSVTENVPAWLRWPLFDLWLAMVHRLGYEAEVLRLPANHYGAPQARLRVFVVATLLGRAALDRAIADVRSRVLAPEQRRTVADFAQWDAGTWRDSVSAGEKGSRQRIEAGLALGVDRWWCQHVTNHRGKRADTPLSTLTGADQHVLCRRAGARVEYRTLLASELLAVQGFPASYKLPSGMTRRNLCRAIGNAVAVPVARALVGSIIAASGRAEALPEEWIA